MRRRATGTTISLTLTADIVRERLKPLLPGDDEVVAPLVQTALRHYEPHNVGPSVMLLVGPTPSSKLYVARCLAHAVEAPFADGDVHGFTATGGQQMAPVLYQLLLACDFDLTSAQHGVVCVHGMDGRPAQQRLLQLFGSGHKDEPLKIDISRLFFFCDGDFSGLDEIVARSGRHAEQQISKEALLTFGMMAEFVDHLRAVIRVPLVDEKTLSRVVLAADFSRMGKA